MVKAVSINFDGSLVLRDDILYDVLADVSPRSDNAESTPQKDLTIIVGVKGASDFLPAISKSVQGKALAHPVWASPLSQISSLLTLVKFAIMFISATVFLNFSPQGDLLRRRRSSSNGSKRVALASGLRGLLRRW
jgi:hypothetical protein